MKKNVLLLLSFFILNLMGFDLKALEIQAPPTPGNLTLVSTTHNSATIKWDNVASNGGLMGYLVYLDGAQERDTVFIGNLVGYTDHYPQYRNTGNPSDYKTLNFTAYELDPATTYSLEVAAIDSALNVSGKSPALGITTEANAPDGKFILYPTDDANVVGGQGNYQSFNMGDYPLMLLRTKENFDGWHTGSRPFIKFDISGVEQVTSAKLKMFGGLWDSKDWLDEQPIYTIKVCFYEVGSDWDEETIIFANVPEDDIGADLEGDPGKRAFTNRDTLLLYTPISYTEITNDPARLGVSAPADPTDNVQWTWFEANFKPFMDAKIAEGVNTLSFTMVDTTFNKYNMFRFYSKDAWTNRLHLEVEGILNTTTVESITLDKQFSVFPNPLVQGNELMISFMENDSYTIEITDLTGRKVHTSNIKDAKYLRLNTSSLTLHKGIYLVRATNSRGVSGVKKVLIN